MKADPVNNIPGENLVNRPPADPVNKVARADLVNRLSPMQRAIINALDPMPEPAGGYISLKGMPTTGGVIERIGRLREPKSYASVSRSLERLVRAGLVEACSGQLCIQGRGFRYALSDAGMRLKGRDPAGGQ